MQDSFNLRFSPLQGYTDDVYRQAHARCFGGVECYYSPFVRVEHGEIRRKDVRDVEPDNNRGLRLVPQLIASDPEKGERILSLFADKGWKEADVNLGCPFPVLAKRHNGASMLPHPDEVEQLLTTLCEKFPQMRLSVKLRLGWERADECLALLPLLNRLPLTDVILHPRLGRQQYKGLVDMEGFRAFYEGCEKPLFYNGDLLTTDDIDRIRHEFPWLAGAVIGRGLLANPALALEYAQGKPLAEEEKRERIRQMHTDVFCRYADRLEGGDQQLLMKMKSFWEYLLPDADRKARKAIHKATRLEAYQQAVNSLLKF